MGNNIKIPFGIYKGQIIHISSAVPGEKYECCECGGELIPIISNKIASHFRHKIECKCDGGVSRVGGESPIHKYAKKVIQEEKKVYIDEDNFIEFREVKEEYKNQEGDPQIKGKQRQRMQEASRRRMMQKLPEADVVITNPTHFAVAIKYDPDLYDAPYVVAKGADYLAQKIKETAKEHHIEIVENKPLARMLYANVEVGSVVPPELYQAVAEVLAFVYHLQGKV